METLYDIPVTREPVTRESAAREPIKPMFVKQETDGQAGQNRTEQTFQKQDAVEPAEKEQMFTKEQETERAMAEILASSKLRLSQKGERGRGNGRDGTGDNPEADGLRILRERMRQVLASPLSTAKPSPAKPSPAKPSPAQPSPAKPSPAQPKPEPLFFRRAALRDDVPETPFPREEMLANAPLRAGDYVKVPRTALGWDEELPNRREACPTAKNFSANSAKTEREEAGAQ